MSQQTLLIELGTEELPPKSLLSLATAFQSNLLSALIDADLVDANTQITNLSAPRRLAFLVHDVSAQQQAQEVERKGPAVKSAFKEDGSPTPALIGFSKSCGANLDDLERRETEKGEWLFFKQTVAGKSIQEIVQDGLEATLKRLPIAKRMRWGSSDVEFVRPVHWLICLFGDQVLPVSILGLTADQTTQGHRFHSKEAIQIDHADHYEKILKEKGFVQVDFDSRKEQIKHSIENLAASVNGTIEQDEDLLNEVTALVEYPNPILGNIDERFMSVPQESLISSMRDHQKYFHVVDNKGKLLPHFITVSNIKSSDEDRVRSGNERVLRARLSDAEFFWETDKKTSLEDRLPSLENVMYHKKLGNMANKVNRLEVIARDIAKLIEANEALSARGAKLAKADLTSNMVGEFSDLQGIMGRYYALNDGEHDIVQVCAEQHYWPKSATDDLPEIKEAAAVALADKLDSLVGIFTAGETPTGDKDPYALRRAALGVLRICIDGTTNHYELKLSELVTIAANAYSAQGIPVSSETTNKILDFIQSRYKAYYQDIYDTKLINAVSASGMDCPADFYSRLQALNVFDVMPEAHDLAAANKRISNILKKSDDKDILAGDIDTALLEQGTEQDLFTALKTLEPEVNALFSEHSYDTGLTKLATLRDPIDAFFDEVMVMAEDEAVKINRLKLLQKLQNLFLRVADISVL